MVGRGWKACSVTTMQLKTELRNQWLNPLRSENYSLKKGYFIIFPRKLTETLKIYPDSKIALSARPGL